MTKTEEMELIASKLAHRNGRNGRCGSKRAVRCVLTADEQAFAYYLEEEEVDREIFSAEVD